MYIMWTKSGGTSYNGVTHIDYTFIQDSYGPLPADYISNGDYGWPEHYTSGNVTKYSGFSYYSVLMPSIINSGFAKCTADITLMYNDGASTTTISKVPGFGNYGG